MHKKYADKGLVVLTVSIDRAFHPAEKPKAEAYRADVEKMLRKLNATRLSNLMLDESKAFVTERMKIGTAPVAYVFTRDGKWQRFGYNDGDHDPETMDAFIVQQLGAR
jgi:hypothetical protein